MNSFSESTMDTISLTIDNQQITTEPGRTVLQAAEEAGISIPTICAHEDLPSYGACRMCVVEIEGMRGYPTSCTTPVSEGMVVQTDTTELRKLRNQVMEFILSGHPDSCLVCDHREDCEKYRPNVTKAGRSTRCGFCSNRDVCMVRNYAITCYERHLNLPTLYCHYNLERDDPFMERDLNLCILCGLCWRICEKIHGSPAISINNRGRWAKVGTAFNSSYVDSGCTFCGACIDICPTGTLTDRYARWYGKGNFGWETVCTLCPEGCKIKSTLSDNKVVSTEMISFDRESRICALGRFAYAQLMNAPKRLKRPYIRDNDELTPVSWPDAIDFVAKKLAEYEPGQCATIVDSANIRENLHLYRRFTEEAMQGRFASVPAGDGFDDIDDESLKADLQAGKIKAVVLGGDYLDPELLEGLDCLIVLDYLPSAATKRADAVLPVAILAELTGTFRDDAGEIKPLKRAVDAAGEARPEWMILRDLAGALNRNGWPYDDINGVTEDITNDPAPQPWPGSPRDSLKDLPPRFRGAYLADTVPALKDVGLPSHPTPIHPRPTTGFKILKHEEVVPNFFLITIEAPKIAQYARPGQFVILMVDETSERVPFTLADWDAEAGTITLIIEEVGRSSGELVFLSEGDFIAHVTGPLGVELPVPEGDTIALGGGCYGIGAIYPIARELKQLGKKVITVLEACSSYTLYMESQFREVSDEVIIMTKDGGKGMKGGVQEAFTHLVDRGTKVDQFVAVGCTFMMRMVTETTRNFGIPLQVALNPIMVDGTGMCGACRITIGDETKFACIDGPFFDGHQVDWDELGSRRGAYAAEEIEAIPQDTHHHEKLVPITTSGGCALDD